MKRLLLLCVFGVLFAGSASAGDKPKAMLSASAIQVELTEGGDTAIPSEFRYAIYERLIDRLQASGTFSKVYRSGDRGAKDVKDLVTLRTTVGKFKAGSRTERELLHVVGSTQVDIDYVVSRDGKSILENKVSGKVRFFGDNIGVINDVGKRITKALAENFGAAKK